MTQDKAEQPAPVIRERTWGEILSTHYGIREIMHDTEWTRWDNDNASEVLLLMTQASNDLEAQGADDADGMTAAEKYFQRTRINTADLLCRRAECRIGRIALGERLEVDRREAKAAPFKPYVKKGKTLDAPHGIGFMMRDTSWLKWTERQAIEMMAFATNASGELDAYAEAHADRLTDAEKHFFITRRDTAELIVQRAMVRIGQFNIDKRLKFQGQLERDAFGDDVKVQ